MACAPKTIICPIITPCAKSCSCFQSVVMEPCKLILLFAVFVATVIGNPFIPNAPVQRRMMQQEQSAGLGSTHQSLEVPNAQDYYASLRDLTQYMNQVKAVRQAR